MTDIVNGLLLWNGTILLAKRSAGRRAYPNRWSFPGGHVEAGESLHDALIRELREEIGVTPLSFEQIGAIEEPNAQANGDATYHMFAVTAWSGGEPRALGREHSELSWFDLKAAGELRDLAMPDYLPILLRCAVMIDPKAVDGRTGTIGHLEAALAQNGSMSEFLSRFDEIALPGAWLVAGAIAQTVWNLAFGKPAELGIKDVDLVYFDADDLSPETEAAHEHRLRHMFRHFPVKLDVKNEARVHLWYAARFGYPIAPYSSTEDAIATFPTTATAVGVRRRAGLFECCAPFGLDDLFGLVVRPNQRQITRAIYEAKVERWRSVWPQLTFVPWREAVPSG